MSAFKWNSIVTTLTRNEKPAAMLGWLALLVTLLHIKSALWLSHPLPANTVTIPKPLEVTLLPVPVVKAKVEPVIPEPVEVPKKKSPPPKAKPKPAAKPVPVPKPKPVVQNPPIVKPVTPKAVEPQPAVIQTPSKSAPQPTDYIQKANPEKATTNTNNNSTTKPAAETKQSAHGNDNGGGVSSGVVALERVQPKYPSRALNRHIEGKVTLEFTISPSGSVIDPKVKQADPEDIFDDAALDAIKKWKFKQKIVNGVSVEQRASQSFNFKSPTH